MNSVEVWDENYQNTKSVKAAKDAIQADEQASKILRTILPFNLRNQVMAQTGQMPDGSFKKKMLSFSKTNQNALCQILAKQQHLVSIYLSDIEKIVLLSHDFSTIDNICIL